MCTLINKICSPLPCFKPKTPVSKEYVFFEKIQKIWPAVPERLKEHSDFCKFLYTSRLIFTMVGYKNSLDKQDEQTAVPVRAIPCHLTELLTWISIVMSPDDIQGY